jgi:hypothetical protein
MSKERVLGIVRHTLTFLGGLLIMQGVADEALVAELSGSVLTLVGGIWSIVIKK